LVQNVTPARAERFADSNLVSPSVTAASMISKQDLHRVASVCVESAH
jgi:hypothetical protein